MNTALQLGVNWGSVRARINDGGGHAGAPGKGEGHAKTATLGGLEVGTLGGQRARASPGRTPRPCRDRPGALTQLH
eukprot:2044793-Pyramimonas_sp.AAC.1